MEGGEREYKSRWRSVKQGKVNIEEGNGKVELGQKRQ